MILGIGTDLVDCRRIEKTLERFGDRFISRVFTPQEQKRVNQRLHKAAGYAKLFAMKEAVLKALGTGLAQGIVWHDIEIFRETQGAPSVELFGVAKKILKNRTPAAHKAVVHVSVSDEWPYAQAFAMINITPL